MAVKLGDILEGSESIHGLPGGTKVVRVGDNEVKERGNSGGNRFTDGSQATGRPRGTKWVVVGLSDKLDVTRREDVALIIRRAFVGDNTLTELSWDSKGYLAAADAVLEAFREDRS